jgi:hypothetical protein
VLWKDLVTTTTLITYHNIINYRVPVLILTWICALIGQAYIMLENCESAIKDLAAANNCDYDPEVYEQIKEVAPHNTFCNTA